MLKINYLEFEGESAHDLVDTLKKDIKKAGGFGAKLFLTILISIIEDSLHWNIIFHGSYKMFLSKGHPQNRESWEATLTRCRDNHVKVVSFEGHVNYRIEFIDIHGIFAEFTSSEGKKITYHWQFQNSQPV